MAKFRVKKLGSKAKFTLVFVLISVLLVGLFATIVTLDREVSTQTITASAFDVGGLNAQGKYEEDETSLYMKEFVKVDGLKIELSEDMSVDVTLYLYDEDKKLLSTGGTVSVSSDYTYTTVGNAVYFRLELTKSSGNEVELFEKVSLVNQVKITVDRE